MDRICHLRVFDYVSVCATGSVRESEVYPERPQMEKNTNAPITPIRPLSGDSAPLGVINTTATRGGNGSHSRGGGWDGPQGHIPHKKNPEGENRLGWGPKSPPWTTTVLNLEFEPWPLVITTPLSHPWHFVVFLSREFFLPEISAPPPSGTGLWAGCGWWKTW